LLWRARGIRWWRVSSRPLRPQSSQTGSDTPESRPAAGLAEASILS
jgi:hypothetical protein